VVWLNGTSLRVDDILPLDTALISSYMLSVLSMLLSETIWPKFAIYLFGGGARVIVMLHVT